MQLIIGNRQVNPLRMKAVAGGVEAVLQGGAMLSLLDAAFHGAGTIEVYGGTLDRRPLELARIEMRGAETCVTLLCRGPAPMLA
ncbi:hypothetical protein IQ03_00297 [Gemmobacter caeni]|uniref:Uncharacterized protein n=1 Tax=Gemmobacter caeni TaxID=589035 RepID=A0A2T6BBC3_9RHOB|nr:hypothetical protein [Gemmobacter caeni]PTX53384.1 hypothetical protein C8N34_101299 [Gemmobacter caeni]TWJ05495.1 hypothetical protein IQ03_00297 [Gemmobacter caeni]